MVSSLKRFFLGTPIKTAHAIHERVSKVTGLAVFSSDALSSVAYATEEILLVLVAIGAAALQYSIPISIAIVLLLTIVAISYRQTIHAYPSGGGAYIVAKDNLGSYPGLVAAAALLIDYVLTVAVSIAAGVAAITSAIPVLYPHREALGLVFILLVSVANLRGVKESGKVFAGPTYFFIAMMFLLIVVGAVRLVLHGAPPPPVISAGTGAVSLFLVLRAFASGCTAMTGVEAVSNGVPAFKPPEAKNAAITLSWMAAILVTLFLGITVLGHVFGTLPGQETVVSQIGRAVFGSSILYYLLQASTAAILVLAANTSYADFPRLGSLLARDGYVPRQFSNRGDRLVFSNGILILGLLAGLLIVIFEGETHRLIPLYAVGVFLSFTLSQAGMVKHWLKLRGRSWRRSAIVNGIGAISTGVVLIVVAATKFLLGAWVVILLLPLIVLGFIVIHRHYATIAKQLSLEGVNPRDIRPRHNTVIILISGIHRPVISALQYAKSLSNDVTAVYVNIDDATTERIKSKWKEWSGGVPLKVLESPYRSITGPLLDYIEKADEERHDDIVTIVLPEFVTARWWHHFLHNQTALLIKGAMLFRKNKVVVSVPFHLHK